MHIKPVCEADLTLRGLQVNQAGPCGAKKDDRVVKWERVACNGKLFMQAWHEDLISQHGFCKERQTARRRCIPQNSIHNINLRERFSLSCRSSNASGSSGPVRLEANGNVLHLQFENLVVFIVVGRCQSDPELTL